MTRRTLFTSLFFLIGMFPLLGSADMPEPGLGWSTEADVFVLHHPPDPVNVRNGNFFFPLVDMTLPCYNYPLRAKRTYNSVSRTYGLFGYGWNFNYDLQIAITPGDTLTVVEGDGYINVYVPEGEQDINDKDVKRILTAKKKEDVRYLGKAQKQSVYDAIEKKLRNNQGFFRRQWQRYLADRGKGVTRFVSHQRGTSVIELIKNGYERTSNNGQVEKYAKDGKLLEIRDRFGNGLTFKYDRKRRPDFIRDSCGQSFKISYNSDGRIARITDSLLRSFSYEYDDNQLLVRTTDYRSRVVRYIYDKDYRRLSKVIFPDGRNIFIVYNKNNGMVERQDGPGKKKTSYTYGRRGWEYMWAEVSDNQGGYAKWEFFPKDYKTIYTNQEREKQITVNAACCNKPLRITNPKGEGEFFTYDKDGNVTEKKSSDGLITKYKYEERFSQVSEVMTPDGVTHRYSYDSNGSLVSAQNSKGRQIRMKYDSRGKVISVRTESQTFANFTFNKTGKATNIELSKKEGDQVRIIGEMRIEYEKDGSIKSVSHQPEQVEVLRRMRKELVAMFSVLSPAGIKFEI